MKNKKNILVIIAARGSSKGVKGKNFRILSGLPLIAHTIIQAKKWGKADKIICSTDSAKIAKIAGSYGIDVPFKRPAYLASDTASKIQVLRHAVETVEMQSKTKYQIIIDLDVTSPLRKIDDIDGALAVFLKKRPKTVFSVTPCRRNPYFNMIEINNQGYATLAKTASVHVNRRQDAPAVYDMNASIYIYDRDYLLDKKTFSAISDRSLVWVMDEFSAIDIDSEFDFRFIEFLVDNKVVRL